MDMLSWPRICERLSPDSAVAWVNRWSHLPAGLLLGRVGLLGSISSLGPALWASGGRQPCRPALAALIVAGAFTRGGPESALLALVQLAVISLCLRHWPFPALRPHLVSLALAHVVKAAWIAAQTALVPYEIWIWFLELVLLLTLQVLLTRVLEGSFRSPLENMLGRVMFLSLAAAGTWGWHLGPIRVWAVAAGLLILAAACQGRVMGGAPAGIIVGSAMSLASLPSAFLIGLLGLSGLTAGALSFWGKGAMVAGLVASGLVLSLGAPSNPVHFPYWWELAVAGVAFAALPARIYGPAGSGGKVLPLRRSRPGASQRRLEIFARALREMSHALQEPAGAAEAPVKAADPSSIVSRLVGEVCRGCPGYSHCWEGKRFYSTYNGILDLVAGVRTEPPDSCREKELMGRYLERRREVARVEESWSRRASLGRDLLTGQLTAVADVLEEMTRGDAGSSARRPRPPFRFSVATESVPRQGSEKTGDSVMTVQSDDTLMAALSDGMGSGRRAATESATLLSLLEKLLDSGVSHEMAIRAANAIMLLRSSDELFATLDLLVADRHSARCRFCKVGAAASFIVRDGRVLTVTADTLPVGIVEDPDVNVTANQLRSGDVVAMVTDGVLLDDPHDPWLKRYLSRRLPPPRTLARDIIRTALTRTDGVAPDDMTVLVARLEARRRG